MECSKQSIGASVFAVRGWCLLHETVVDYMVGIMPDAYSAATLEAFVSVLNLESDAIWNLESDEPCSG